MGSALLSMHRDVYQRTDFTKEAVYYPVSWLGLSMIATVLLYFEISATDVAAILVKVWSNKQISRTYVFFYNSICEILC